MSTNIFKSNNCFIGCEDSTQKEAFYTGIRTGSILSTVQTSSFDVSINRTRGKQLGSSRYAVNSSIRHPDVNLSFNYIQSWPYINEALVNFADLNDVETSSDEAVPQVFSLSGYESASKNFYIFHRLGESDALSGFNQGDIVNLSGYQCASVGNCYLTNYSLNYSVGTLPSVNVGFNGSNMEYVEVTGLNIPSPAINLTSGNANQVGEITFSGLREFSPNPVVMNPSNTGSSIILENLQVGGQPLAGDHLLQSVDLNIQIPRVPSYKLGSDYVCNRKMILPANGSVEFTSRVSGWNSGFISGILSSESGYNFDLTLNGSGKSISYKIEDAKLQGYNYRMAVNGLMDFDASFSFDVSPNPKGLQVSGNAQQDLSLYAREQIDQHFDASMDVASNGSMLTGFTDPNGVLGGGGYGAARLSSFWAKDIDFSAVSVWNNRGYGTPADYRMRGATAVTKRHIVMAKHFWLVNTDKLWFVTPDGTWIERTISRTDSHGSEDITVGLLDSDLPSTITPVKVVPANFETYFNRDSVGQIDEDFRPIVVGFDHEKKGLLLQLTRAANSANNVTYFDGATVPSPYDGMAEDLEAGDSGNPLFIIIDGEPVLITSFYTTSPSPAYNKYISAINALITSIDTAEGISTGYTLTEKDLSHLNLKRYPPLF
jgi:hypothetical protein